MKATGLAKERKRAEDLVRESEHRYRRLLASVTNYVYSVALGPERAQATTHGPGCEAVTGYTSQEFEADPFLWYRMIFSEDRPAVMAQIERVLAGETPAPLEHRIVHRDGRLRWIRNAPVPHRDEQGRLIAYDGLVSDITERKRAELALRESQERLALVIEGSNDGIWDWDLTTDEVYYSPRWKAMLGYDNHELPNRYSSWEQLLHPADRERSLASLQAYLSGQTATFELEHRLRHKDGNYRWILARGVALRDAQGKPIRMAGSHVDLTAHKEAAEKLEKAYRELSKNEASLRTALEKLKAANKELRDTQLQLIQAAKLESVGTLAAGVAHEVKNPLQTILMGVDYLENSGGGGDRNSIQLVLNNMRAAVTRANSIVRELLMLSAPTDFKPQAEDLNALIEDTLSIMEQGFRRASIEIVREFATDLPMLLAAPSPIAGSHLAFRNAGHRSANSPFIPVSPAPSSNKRES